VDFNPGTDTNNLTSLGYNDIFIQKLDANGIFLWVKQLGGIEHDYGKSTTIDANGNVYTTGHFQGTADFDPGTMTSNLTPLGLSDVFILKLDANGNFLWVKQLGDTTRDYGNSITIDTSGDIYSTGSFQDHFFVQKLDANGDLIWLRQMVGESLGIGNYITTDGNDDVYTTGRVADTVEFDAGPGITNSVSPSWYQIFIQKLDANGNFIWATQTLGYA